MILFVQDVIRTSLNVDDKREGLDYSLNNVVESLTLIMIVECPFVIQSCVNFVFAKQVNPEFFASLCKSISHMVLV